MLGLSEDQKTIKLNLKIKVVKKGDDSCAGCIFLNRGQSCMRGYCTPLERKDGKSIIWVEAI